MKTSSLQVHDPVFSTNVNFLDELRLHALETKYTKNNAGKLVDQRVTEQQI